MKESRDPQLQKYGDGRGFMSGYFIRYRNTMTKHQFLEMLCKYIPSFKYWMEEHHKEELTG